MTRSSAVRAASNSVDPGVPTSNVVRQHGVDIEEIATTLDALASDIRSLWTSALARGDPSEVSRLVEAGHAVLDALAVLRADRLIAAPSTTVEQAFRSIGRPEA